MPPNADDLTHEEQFDYDTLGTPVVADFAGTLEIKLPDDDDNSIISGKIRKKNSRKSKIELSVVWTIETKSYTIETLENSSMRNSDTLAAETNNMSPVELLEEYFTECVYDIIADETNRYVHEVKKKLNINVTKDEIKTYIGFLILSGYHTLPSERGCWAETDALGVTIVKDEMIGNFYLLQSSRDLNQKSKIKTGQI